MVDPQKLIPKPTVNRNSNDPADIKMFKIVIKDINILCDNGINFEK